MELAEIIARLGDGLLVWIGLMAALLRVAVEDDPPVRRALSAVLALVTLVLAVEVGRGGGGALDLAAAALGCIASAWLYDALRRH